MIIKKIHILLLFLLSQLTYAQNSNPDSLCCMCQKIEIDQISKIIPYKNLLRNIDPNYINLCVSLSENIDINLYEKYFYMQNLDKYVKFDISKKMYILDSINDSISNQNKIELNKLKNALKFKIQSLQQYLEKCEEIEEIRNYINKKNIILDIDPDYYKNFINLTNSTIDNNIKNYQKLIEMDNKLLGKCSLRIDQLEKKGRDFWNTNDKLNYNYLIVIQNETKNKIRINENNLANQNKNITPLLKSEDQKNKYIIKELIKYSDTMKFVYNANIDSKLLVNKDTFSYYFIPDSSLTKVIHYQTYNPINLSSVNGFFYTIQIGTYNKDITFGKLLLKRDLIYKDLTNGNIRYSYGMFLKKEQVDSVVADLKAKGLNDFVVIAYNKGEQITLEEALKISETIILNK
ncbi:MAG: hypothetical protein HYU67_09990 [Flavobacteriia bacterium]|nr:hypothetical protein [Flavobacteriia bacterium]